MNGLSKVFGVCLLGFSLIACNSTPQKVDVNAKPAWIDNPYQKDKRVAVGQSAPHFKGKAEQRKVAMARAIDELSAQMGVKVTTATQMNQTMTGVDSRLRLDSQSSHSVDNKVVNAKVEAEWTDPASGTFYILMVAE
jgi:hypothetical protein